MSTCVYLYRRDDQTPNWPQLRKRFNSLLHGFIAYSYTGSNISQVQTWRVPRPIYLSLLLAVLATAW